MPLAPHPIGPEGWGAEGTVWHAFGNAWLSPRLIWHARRRPLMKDLRELGSYVVAAVARRQGSPSEPPHRRAGPLPRTRTLRLHASRSHQAGPDTAPLEREECAQA
jgi:hypothetical protein